MKRVISILFTVALIFSMCAVAYADSTLDMPGAETTATVIAEIPENYVVVIPSEIYAFSPVTLTAQSMNLLEGHNLKIYCQEVTNGGDIVLTDANGREAHATVSGLYDSGCVGLFIPNSLTSNFAFSVDTLSVPGAGTFTGQMTFVLQIVDT